MTIEYQTFSECGPRRNNEDFIMAVADPEAQKWLFVLCDGMGGMDCGEIASRTVATELCAYWQKNITRRDTVEKITDACHEASDALNHVGNGAETGTTMAMVAIDGNRVLAAHCGDSRIYIIDGQHNIIYRSTDHVRELPEGWTVLRRAFVSGRNCWIPEVRGFEIKPGYAIVICSDGLTGRGKELDLENALTDPAPLTADRLLFIGSHPAIDNYSAIIINFKQ